MKILDRLTGSTVRPGAPAADAPARTKGLSFQSRMQRLSGARAASWRQLLRVNREAQVDPLIGPPTPPAGFSGINSTRERNIIRNLIDKGTSGSNRRSGGESASGASGNESVQRMLNVLSEGQSAQDNLMARSARAAAKWQ